ncbi:ShlB/FhaC/HecB family hemolysin secretion/activation protein [Phormidium sp. CLA17]|uniref:ShlB/FhaC/HecB family hemolysin secretion/activation protein n=1 Tax=Leptolyngbya sp. Cla-17 TaxID=2803751 RepID=UPI0014910C0E|nr:ShlB/FhaC/HecB family hemolysin secretion/activation protein [Leptolyngbya sp. Cla-17]MBM0743038.1 ShlB/FhaC/HecB family hemolysin secretion/activation protein [Leptolyngbya sp. Cla-17]
MNIKRLNAPFGLLGLLVSISFCPIAIAQLPTVDPRGNQPPSLDPLPIPRIEPIPSPDQLLPPSPGTPSSPDQLPVDSPQAIQVTKFVVVGSTVFSDKELTEAITQSIGAIPATGRTISLTELFQARSAITNLYTSRGYLTSGAYIPPQKLQSGMVEIRVVEGSLEDIRVTGTTKLEPGYVASRIGIATQAPLNRDRLLEALQLLQLNPLIANISAELSAGSRPGTSLLEIKVTEAKSASATFTVDNARVPSVGSIRGQASGLEQNLLGYGDTLSLAFTKTDGSNSIDLSYTLPVSPYNTTISVSGGFSSSDVVEAPFNILDIHSESNYLELTARHPLIQTPTQELALGLTLGRRSTRTQLLGDIPFPSPGADTDGRTTESVVRFFQEYTKRSSQSVFALRSQFNVGVSALGSTVNVEPPDTRFFTWRGQAQLVRLLAPETLLIVRGDLQFGDRPLLPIEQFGVGGQLSVRGYRQDLLLTDNGAFGSAEVRIPILRLPKQQALLQLTPFVDYGQGWNNGESPNPEPSALVSAGFGLRLQVSNNFTARMDFGFPLVQVNSQKETLQEKGIYFSVVYTLF